MKSLEKGFYMNQKDLIYIKTIVDEGGITQAAKKLFVSQPSLSQSLKRIEESLGVTLFKRTPKGLVLTIEGEEFYQMAVKVMHMYDSFEEEMQNLKELKTGNVIVGTTPHRGMVLFPEFLAEFYLKYPGIRVEMLEAPTNELEELLLNGKVDLAVLREPVQKPSVERFLYHGLSRESFMIVLPKGHPAGMHAEAYEKNGKKGKTLDPKWLAEETFLLPDTSLRLYESVTSILKAAGIPNPTCAYHALYMETLVHLAAAGAGVAVVSTRYVKKREVDKIADVYKIPESYGTFWEVSFATLKDSYLSRAAQAFIEEYRRYLGV